MIVFALSNIQAISVRKRIIIFTEIYFSIYLDIFECLRSAKLR